MSLRTFRTMDTPKADVRAPRRLTPRMQAYCVSALSARVKMCFGMMSKDVGRTSIGGSPAVGDALLDFKDSGKP